MISNQKVVNNIGLCYIWWAHIYTNHIVSNRTISFRFSGGQCDRGYIIPTFNEFIFNTSLICSHKIVMVYYSYQNIIKTNNAPKIQLKWIPQRGYCYFGKLTNSAIIFREIFYLIIAIFSGLVEFAISVCTTISATFKVFVNEAIHAPMITRILLL